MNGFIIVWIGQIISILASGMSGFGLSIWMFEKTKSATAMGLMQVSYILPFLLLSPIAGVMVDRYNRKLMMMISDFAAVTATFAILILQATGHLQFWHLYIANVLYGLGNTFQWPAYSAAISTMVPKEQYGRANGLMSLMEAGPGVLAPILAGAVLATSKANGLTIILLVDVITFFIALGALTIVHVPQPKKTLEGQKEKGSIWKEAAYGFTYIFKRPSLLGLQMIFFFGNLFSGIAMTVFAPMILLRTDNNSVIFGAVNSAAAIGGVAGGLIMSAWGGFKKRVHGVLAGWIATGILSALFGFGTGLAFWIPFIIAQALIGPLINTSNQSIWQAKVAPDIQGRVFSARRLIAWFTQPIAPIIAGVMADKWLEPSMTSGTTSLAFTFSSWVGTGPGSGMALLFIFCGLGSALVGLSGYFVPFIRNAETILPDHDQLQKAAGTPA
ncbi:MAG: MFS transporter [Chloroflexi bacterium]|nr:MFS transporter [Chloroflexota bacterium]